VSRSQIAIKAPINTIGMHEVKVVLHPEVSVTVKANVARSPEEAELQAQGVDVLAEQADERNVGGFTEEYDPNAEPGTILGDEGETADAAPEAPVAEESNEEA
jgi:large subunit ribosomal protein L9